MSFTHESDRLIVVVDLDNYRSDDSVVEVDGPLATIVDFTLPPAFTAAVAVIADVPMLNVVLTALWRAPHSGS